MPVSSVTSATNARARDDADADARAMDDARDGRATMGEIATAFALMGWTAFGGPAAHVGLFDKTFVSRDDDDEDEDEDDGEVRRPPPAKGVDDARACSAAFSARAVHARTDVAQMSFAIGTTQRGVIRGVDERGVVSVSAVDVLTLAGRAAWRLVNPSKARASVHRGSERGGGGVGRERGGWIGEKSGWEDAGDEDVVRGETAVPGVLSSNRARGCFLV